MSTESLAIEPAASNPWRLRARNFVIRLFLAVVALEVIFRLGSWWTQATPTVIADPTLGWRLEANVVKGLEDSAGPYIVKTNSRGLRDKEYPYAKSPDRRRIVALGGSNIFGIGVPAEDSCTEILERNLHDVEVINMGRLAYEADQMFVLLKDEGLRYKPDVVLQFISCGTSSLFSAEHPDVCMPKCYLRPLSSQGDFEIAPPTLSAWHGLTPWSKVLRCAETLYLQMRTAAREVEPTRSENWEQVRIAKKLLESTRHLVESRGARHVVVMYPVNTDEAPQARRIVRELADEGKLTLLDLSPMFDAYYEGLDEHELMSWENAHMTEFCHYRVAEAVRDFLLEEEILPRL